MTNAGKKRYKATNGNFVKQYNKGDRHAGDMFDNVYYANHRLSKTNKRAVDVAGSISMVALGVLLGNKIYDMHKENAEYNSDKK